MSKPLTKKPTRGYNDQDLKINVEIASDGTYLIRLLMHQTNNSTTIKKTDVVKIAPKTKQTEPQTSQLPRFRRRENLKLLSMNSNNSKSKRERTASTASHRKIIKLPPRLIKFCGLDDDQGQATDNAHNQSQINSTKIHDIFAIEPNQLNNRTIVDNSSDLNTG